MLFGEDEHQKEYFFCIIKKMVICCIRKQRRKVRVILFPENNKRLVYEGFKGAPPEAELPKL